MFTDIEGSTRLLHDLGDEFTALLSTHHAAVRAAIADHEGQEVRTQGDSFFVVFGEPASAVAAAVEAQRALLPNGLRVRVGIHTGDVIVSEDDYVGMDVHRAARISSAGHGGQVVVSAETAAEVASGGTWTLRALGGHVLKDLPAPEELWQVVADGLPNDFPPLRVHERPAAAAQLPDYSEPPANVPCPYVGLAAFRAADSERFHGREELIEDVLERLRAHPVLILVGASGSGKSSLLGAGVLPALEREVDRPVVAITPGANPLGRLRSAGRPGVLAVDQLEETFTLCADDEERNAFLAGLFELAHEGTKVVLALRADFYGRSSAHPKLGAVLQDHPVVVGPMGEEALRRAIELPARTGGLSLDPGLVPTILRDIAGQPGALPLVSHALLETWKRRSGRLLTLVGYIGAGGVHGALAQTAEAAFAALDPTQQAIARVILLRLSSLGEGTEPTRRRVSQEELELDSHAAQDVQVVLHALTAARLLTVGDGEVDVTHEALIRHWPRLRGWLQEDREGHLLHRRLTEASQEWAVLSRDPGSLYRGARLEVATELASRRGTELNRLEQEFLRSSREAERHDLEQAEARQRRLRRLLVLLAGVSVIAVATALFAVRETRRARDQERLALSSATAGEATQALRNRLDRALVLGLDAFRLAPVPEARQALLAAIQRTRGLEGILAGRHSVVTAMATGAGGRWLASGGVDGGVVLWDRARRRAIADVRVEGQVRSLAFDEARGILLAGTETGVIALLDAKDLERRGELRGHLGPVTALVATADGARSASGFDGTVRRWDLDRPDAPGPVTRVPVASEGAVSFSPDGARVAFVTRQGGLVVADSALRERVRVPWAPAPVRAVAFASDGRFVVAGDARGRVAFGRVGSPRPVSLRRVTDAPVRALAVDPDSRRVAITAADGRVSFADVSTMAVTADWEGHAAAGTAAAYAPGFLATGGRDGSVLLWHPAGAGALERTTSAPKDAISLSVRGDGRLVAVGRGDGGVVLRRGATSMPILRTSGVTQVAFAPDGRALAVTDRTSSVRLVDPGTGRDVRAPLRSFSEEYYGAGFRADGSALAAWSDNGTVATWSLPGGQPGPTLAATGGRIFEAAYSPDGRTLAAATSGGSLELFRSPGGRPLQAPLFGTGGELTSLAFSPDGRRIATGSDDGSVQLWEVRERVTRGRGFDDGGPRITDVAFAPSGDVLAATDERTVKFWAPGPTPRLLGLQLASRGPAVSAQFTRDGTRLFVLAPGRITEYSSALWSGDEDVLRARVCALLAPAGC